MLCSHLCTPQLQALSADEDPARRRCSLLMCRCITIELDPFASQAIHMRNPQIEPGVIRSSAVRPPLHRPTASDPEPVLCHLPELTLIVRYLVDHLDSFPDLSSSLAPVCTHHQSVPPTGSPSHRSPLASFPSSTHGESSPASSVFIVGCQLRPSRPKQMGQVEASPWCTVPFEVFL
jgi:hypothetical protein